MTQLGLALFGVLVGLVASFAGLGGGFLVVPLLTLAFGYSPQKAVGTSFLAILVVSVSAVFAHGRLANVDWKAGLLLGVGGVLGAQIGPRLLQGVSAPTFNRIFAGILAALAVQMFFKR